jgi:Cyclic nucleotide-binding domain
MVVAARDHSSLEIRWDVEKWMLLRLTNFGTQLSFGPGDTIVKQGEPGDGLYLILSGSAQVLRGGSDAARALTTLGPFRSQGADARPPALPAGGRIARA